MCDRITSPLKTGRVCVASHVAVLGIPGFDLRTTLEINSKFRHGSMNGRKYCEGEKCDSLPSLNLSLIFSSVTSLLKRSMHIGSLNTKRPCSVELEEPQVDVVLDSSFCHLGS